MRTGHLQVLVLLLSMAGAPDPFSLTALSCCVCFVPYLSFRHTTWPPNCSCCISVKYRQEETGFSPADFHLCLFSQSSFLLLLALRDMRKELGSLPRAMPFFLFPVIFVSLGTRFPCLPFIKRHSLNWERGKLILQGPNRRESPVVCDQDLNGQYLCLGNSVGNVTTQMGWARQTFVSSLKIMALLTSQEPCTHVPHKPQIFY